MQGLRYDAFGRVVLDTNPGFQPFGFAGGLYDHQTGLVRFGFRYYDPEVGRWTAKDPLLFLGGSTSLYTYADNDPVNLIDPDGRDVINKCDCTIFVKPGSAGGRGQGIELGQLAFVAVVLLGMAALKALPVRWPRWSAMVPAYGIGSFAVYWLIERVAGLVTGA
jgi:RHS repeat-associated protein